jgi:cell division protein FtsB
VSDLETQVAASHKKTDELKARNAKLDSEVRDLKDGTGAVEERARYELGMIKQNEIFVQVLDENGKPSESKTPLPVPPPAPPAATQKPAGH